MKNKILILCLMILSVTASGTELKKNKVSLFGLLNMNAIETDEINLGAGASVDFLIDTRYSVEVGTLFVNKVVEVGDDNFFDYNALHVPVMFNVVFNNGIKAGLGPFLETSTDELFEDIEFGLDLALSKDFVLSNGSNFFVEGRYSSRITEANGADFDQLMLLAGLRFRI